MSIQNILRLATATFLFAGAAGLGALPARASLLRQIDRARDWRAAAAEDALALPARGILTKHSVETAPGTRVAVKGSRERRQVRFARWADALAGDRARIHALLGRPPFRHYERSAGDRLEFWTYPGERRMYIFRGNRLVRRETA